MTQLTIAVSLRRFWKWQKILCLPSFWVLCLETEDSLLNWTIRKVVFDYREMVYLKEVCLLLFCITSTQMINCKTCRPNDLYADDLWITCQDTRFDHVEETLSNALNPLKEYYNYKINNLKANPSQTQVRACYLKNRYANKKLNIIWNGQQLQHCDNSVYLGVKLDRSLKFKEHVTKTKAKVPTCNNILRKLTTSKSGASPPVLRTTALALSFSAAEYVCPVWERSAHACPLDPVLNESWRLITGSLKPTNARNLHLLAGIAPPEIRREAASKQERLRQECDPRHMLLNYKPAPQG